MEKFKFKKSLGQNFLRDDNIIHKIVESAVIDDDTLVIEIGPGGGALTKLMVPLCGQILLYEADRRLESSLQDLLKDYSNYNIFIGDFLQANLNEDLEGYSYSKLFVVANLPYYITTPIIMKFIDSNVFPDLMVLMMQREVALRFSALPGSRNYGSITVFLNYFYDIEILFSVSRNCFEPKPNVDSAVIRMKKKKNLDRVRDIEWFKRVVRDSFSMKRKTLRNNLRNYDLEVVEEVLKGFGFDTSVRAEKLSLNVYIKLANRLFDVESK